MSYSYQIGPKTVPETLYSKTYEKEMVVEHAMAEILMNEKVIFRLYSEHGMIVTEDIAKSLVQDLNDGKIRLGALTYC